MIARTHCATRHRAAIDALILIAALLATGCSGPAAPPSGAESATSEPRATPAWGPITITLPGPAATSIATDGPGLDQPRPGTALPARSPCLDRAAAAHAYAAPLLARIPTEFTDRAVSWAGCPDAAVTVATVTTGEPERAALEEVLRRRLRDEPWTHLGVARRAAPVDGRWEWYVLLVRRRIELRPVPSVVEVGATLTLQLRLDPELRSTSVLVTRPDGEVEEAGSGSSGSWMVGAARLDTVGRYWIEVFGEGRSGPEVLALFPVEAGRASPSLWVGIVEPDEPRHGSADAAEALSLQLVQGTRERFGRQRLRADPQLAAIARRYSQEQAAAGRIAHVSPTSGSVVDRLRNGGYRARFASENLAQAGSIRDAHAALLRSPGHRAAMLDPYMTSVGIGVAWTEDHDQRTYFVTQVFTRPLSQLDPQSLAAALHERLGDGRPYDAAATAAADDAIVGGSAPSQVQAERVSRRLARQLPEPVTITVVSGSAFDSDDVQLDDRATDPAVVGIGIAVAAAPSATDPLPYLIVILTRE